MRGRLVAVAALAAWLPVGAAAQQRAAVLSARPAAVDSAEAPQTLFTTRDAYVAAAFAAATLAMYPLDKRMADAVQDSVLQGNTALRRGATFFRWLGYPGSIGLTGTAYVVGRLGGHPAMADVGLHTTEAILLGEAITFSLKSVAGRTRPLIDPEHPYSFGLGRGWRNDDYQSFPSGHATAAFATAAATTSEVGRLWPERKLLVGGVLYGGATLVALSRMYNNKHWASDVVVGSAIGSFSGWKVVSYNHAHPDNRLDRLLLATTVVPLEGGVVVAWRVQF